MHAFLAYAVMMPLCLAFSPSSIRNLSFSKTHGHVSSRITSTATFLANEDADKENPTAEDLEDPPEVIEITDLGAAQIVEMIEVSFINACLQLSLGFVDVLKLFIVAVKAAYENDISPSQLVDDVANCPVNTAGRQLMPEEIQLRTAWVHSVYLILEHIDHQNKGRTSGSDIQESVRSTYAGILPHLVALKESGGTFEANDIMEAHADALPKSDSPLETAIVSQTVRVIWYTLTVLEEESLVNGDTPPEPRPPIPGAYSDTKGL